MGEPQAATADGSLPTPGAPEKAAVRSMFDRIAPRYDLLNRLLSAGIDVRWRRACVDMLDLRGSARIVDLCTGTGDLLIEALRRGEGTTGIGVDLSSAMLVRGQKKLQRGSLAERGSLAAGDAERLPLGDALFDGALVSFGIRNVGNVEAAFREVFRVLKPRGRFVVLEFSMPAGLLGRAYRLYFGRLLPFIGGLISGDRGAYSYLPASVERFPSPSEFSALLEHAGFRSVERRALTGGIAYLYRGEKAA
jgi:demethylmenaquinone methyltransferase/2-methoxy-6-polyprenyl-1,4-benzoquinol methylase